MNLDVESVHNVLQVCVRDLLRRKKLPESDPRKIDLSRFTFTEQLLFTELERHDDRERNHGKASTRPYEPGIIYAGLRLMANSNHAVESARDLGLPIPTIRCLERFKNRSGSLPGINRHRIARVGKEMLEGGNARLGVPLRRDGGLLLDEVSIEGGLVKHPETMKILGYVDYGDVALEHDLDPNARTAEDTKLAKTILQLAVRSFCDGRCFAVAHYPTNGMDTLALQAIVYEVKSEKVKEAGTRGKIGFDESRNLLQAAIVIRSQTSMSEYGSFQDAYLVATFVPARSLLK